MPIFGFFQGAATIQERVRYLAQNQNLRTKRMIEWKSFENTKDKKNIPKVEFLIRNMIFLQQILLGPKRND